MPAQSTKRATLTIWVGLLLLYACFVAVRIAAAFAVAATPTVMMDEALYFNLARSLWTGGEAALRGQPINYDSLLYPLVLSPLLQLPAEVNILRAAQVLNAFLMNLAVFPAWFLARRITRCSRAAWAVALLTLLMPDMTLTRFILTENIGYPMTLLAMYWAWRAMETRKTGFVIATAALGFLMYLTKPGMVVVPLAFCFVLLLPWLKNRTWKNLCPALVCACVLLGLYLAWQAVARWVLDIDYGYHSLYQTQTHALDGLHLLQTLEGTVMYLFYFAVACFVFPLLLPYAYGKALDAGSRSMLWMNAVCVLGTIVVACYIIFVDEHTGTWFYSRIHLRYLAGFVPLALMLSLSPALEGKRLGGWLSAALALLMIGALTLSFDAVFSEAAKPIDGLLMASVQGTAFGVPLRGIAKWVLVAGLLSGGAVLHKVGWTRPVRVVTLVLFAAVSSLNGYFAYDMHQEHFAPQGAMEDAHAVITLAGEDGVLGVVADGQYRNVLTAMMDMHSRTPMMVVEFSDIARNTGLGGAYTPFTPQSYWMEHATRPTPAVQWLATDELSRMDMRLSPDAQIVDAPGGLYSLIYVGDGTPWLHCAMIGLEDSRIGEETTLYVYDETLCQQPSIQITLLVRGEAGELLRLTMPGYSETVEMDGELMTLTRDVPANTGGVPLQMRLAGESQEGILLFGYDANFSPV